MSKGIRVGFVIGSFFIAILLMVIFINLLTPAFLRARPAKASNGWRADRSLERTNLITDTGDLFLPIIMNGAGLQTYTVTVLIQGGE
jgi:hypothetical protein